MSDLHHLRLLLFNLATDVDAQSLGFTTSWINALAIYCEYIDVLTMRVGRLAVAENVRVYSVGKEKGYSEPRRAIEFYRILGRLLNERRYDTCFAHMIPLFVVMGAPLLYRYRIPITLWYTHKSVTLLLRIAEKLVRRIVTASPESFRLPSRKALVVGHGINTDIFYPSSGEKGVDNLFAIAHIGRIAPVKKLETIVEALDLLRNKQGIDHIRVRLVGGVYQHDESYAQRLRELVKSLGLGSSLEFAGPIGFEQIVSEYHKADVIVNMSETGSLDKVILEAMSCGIPVVTSNQAGKAMLAQWADWLVCEPQPEDLAKHLLKLIQLPPAERIKLGWKLRQFVIENHSLDRLIGRLVALFQEH